MTNKYKHFSEQAQQKRKLEKMCERKKAYDSEAEATKQGQRHYLCSNCDKWHRSGSLARLAKRVKRV